MAAAKRFSDKAMEENGDQDQAATDRSVSNKAAMGTKNTRCSMAILVRKENFNNIADQNHCAFKRVTKSMLNFKSFRTAGSVLTAIEPTHMIRKGQVALDGDDAKSFADQFSSLAGIVHLV